jgi:hypothetical protein
LINCKQTWMRKSKPKHWSPWRSHTSAIHYYTELHKIAVDVHIVGMRSLAKTTTVKLEYLKFLKKTKLKKDSLCVWIMQWNYKMGLKTSQDYPFQVNSSKYCNSKFCPYPHIGWSPDPILKFLGIFNHKLRAIWS